MTTEKIFIQIAAYRDPELAPTVLDCIRNAAKPENLVFCIAWQHSPSEKISELSRLLNITILDIPHTSSKGTCWARNAIQQHYSGERYTLQLDSHHRFVRGWDTLCITMLEKLRSEGHRKPALTAYLPSYDPETDPVGRILVPWKLDFDRFIPEGAVFFRPSVMPADTPAPLPARFYSGHFCFADGAFCTEVPHDPNYYFHGEEISISARAFTHGYDFFHPNIVIAWHEYTRKGRTKHWDDHTTKSTDTHTTNEAWTTANVRSHLRNRKLFCMDGETREGVDFGIYDFGTERSLFEYELYSGVNFKCRSISPDALAGIPPRHIKEQTVSRRDFDAICIKKQRYCIDLHPAAIREVHESIQFMAVIFETLAGKPINRHDCTGNELKALLFPSNDGVLHIWREFIAEEIPGRWIVWPYIKDKGWGAKISGGM